MHMTLLLPFAICAAGGYTFGTWAAMDLHDGYSAVAAKSAAVSALCWLGAGVALLGVVL